MSETTKMPAPDGTFPMPEHGFTCFFCGETFTTPGAAALHFGQAPDVDEGYPETACVLNGGAKIEPGREKGLFMVLRKTETELQRLRQQNEQLDHEASYGRGIEADLERYFGKGCKSAFDAFHVIDSMEGRVQVAEQRLAALREAASAAQCACSVQERLSGHLVGCWMPALVEAAEPDFAPWERKP